jgi:hypothetical protein
MTDDTTTTKKAGLSPIEVGAGAGAAVITAFATSYLGTAGTLTGAALASVVGTVSASVLRSSAESSAQKLKHTTTRLRDTRVGHADATDIRPVESEDIDPYGTQLFHTSNWIDPEQRGQIGTGADGGSPDRTGRSRTRTDVWGPGGLAGAAGSEPGSSWGAPTDDGSGQEAQTEGPRTAGAGTSRRRWVVIGAGTAAAFALALGAITGIEAAAGKPLSGLTGHESGGGTTLGRATGADPGTSGGSRPTPTPSPTTGATATEPAPSTGSSPSGGVSATAPSGAPATSTNPTPSPTQPAPTRAPTGSPNPLTSRTP